MSAPQDRMSIQIAICMRGPHPRSRTVAADANIVSPYEGHEHDLGNEIVCMGLPADEDTAATLRQIADEIDRGMLFGWAMNHCVETEIGTGEWDDIEPKVVR